MNHTEFSSEFDVLYNNIMSNAAPGLDEYEKSVLLTKAQEEIVKNHYNPLGNKYREGFDDSPKREIDFSNLMKVETGTPVDVPPVTLDSRAKVYSLPSDLFILVNEALRYGTEVKQVIPLSYDEYTRLMSRPFKGPLKYQAWRIITTSADSTNVEIISDITDADREYIVRYIRRPSPIILTDLSEYNETIDGISDISECELNPILHQEILQRAVELAKVFYQGDIQASVELGQRSE